MINPIMQALKTTNNNIVSDLVGALRGNPTGIYNQMMRNPQFANFVRQNQGKTPEQIASENGIDMNIVNSLLQQLK